MLMINICDKVLNKICSVCWGYRTQWNPDQTAPNVVAPRYSTKEL